MSRGSSNKGMLALMVFTGALGGTLLGDILGSKFKAFGFLSTSYTLGTPNNLYFDLKFINFTFGMNIYVNLMTIICVILAIIIYSRH